MTPTEKAVQLLLAAKDHDVQAQALRREAGIVLAGLSITERTTVARAAGLSLGSVDLLSGDARR